ncbi:hypothetical protein BCR44DRAFT_1424926 [Catenaria anguillulae PL171]|uniref:Secreted protein n=1 Tax=Catenaria anguillulae PL171 TaxID=765915 RepID=A0A1Y2I0J0_9FUNG|nr:hypothetical protein BCR44DRAFT_1424926 [Catenaria anguillulae PL171]
MYAIIFLFGLNACFGNEFRIGGGVQRLNILCAARFGILASFRKRSNCGRTNGTRAVLLRETDESELRQVGNVEEDVGVCHVEFPAGETQWGTMFTGVHECGIIEEKVAHGRMENRFVDMRCVGHNRNVKMLFCRLDQIADKDGCT